MLRLIEIKIDKRTNRARNHHQISGPREDIPREEGPEASEAADLERDRGKRSRRAQRGRSGLE